MNLTKEEIEASIKDLGAQLELQAQFLVDRGWSVTGELWKRDGFQTHSVWKHPKTGKKFAHTLSLNGLWPRAYDRSVEDYIYECGWSSVLQITTFETKLPEPVTWCRYLHPKSNKTYARCEAVEIMLEHDNDDSAISQESLCILTRRMHVLLKDHQIKPGNLIMLQMSMQPDGRFEHNLLRVYETEDDWKSNAGI